MEEQNKNGIKNLELKTKKTDGNSSQFSVLNSVHSIRFGTDGWRGIIANDFTFKNVHIVAQAIADWLKQNSEISIENSKKIKTNSQFSILNSVVIGYDNRFLSDKFAFEIAKVLSANEINVTVSETVATSPSVSLFCKKNKCLGIMITASHNPPDWNGVKIKLQYGGSVSEKVIGEISEFLYKNEVKTEGNSEIKTTDILDDYKRYLRSLVKLNLVSKFPSKADSQMLLGLASLVKKIVVDSMHGSGSGIFEQILTSCLPANNQVGKSSNRKNEKNIISIHNYRDPLFSGINPEPIEKNLTELKKVVLKNRAAVGFAFDGDADRLGIIDDRGRYLSPHIVFPLILLYLLEHRKLKGKIVQAISLGYLSERIAKKFSMPFEEVPVGFKYICEKMLTENVLLGGEESGGYGWRGGIPERDGILSALIITEMLLQTGEKLSVLVDDLQKRFGKSVFLRKDIKLEQPVNKEELVETIKDLVIGREQRKRRCLQVKEKRMTANKGRGCSQIKEANVQRFIYGALRVKEVRTYDGVKIIFDPPAIGWLLLRPSGTEPVLRTYAETDSELRTKKLLDFAEKICFNLLKTTQIYANMENNANIREY